MYWIVDNFVVFIGPVSISHRYEIFQFLVHVIRDFSYPNNPNKNNHLLLLLIHSSIMVIVIIIGILQNLSYVGKI